jgi:hypothetical protein
MVVLGTTARAYLRRPQTQEKWLGREYRWAGSIAGVPSISGHVQFFLLVSWAGGGTRALIAEKTCLLPAVRATILFTLIVQISGIHTKNQKILDEVVTVTYTS